MMNNSIHSLSENPKKSFARNMQLKSSMQKLNLLATMIRGKHVQSAMDVLTFSEKRAASEVLKVLKSAVANAENNKGLDIDQLVVSEAYVGKAFTIKRFRARARGRGAKILKPYSNLTVVVQEMEE